MRVHDLDTTKDVARIVAKAQLLDLLPTIAEIPDVVASMPGAEYHEIETPITPEPADPNTKQPELELQKLPRRRRLSGVELRLPNGRKCFVSGQLVRTDEGEDVFVPGQTVEGELGSEYAPGITVNLHEKPTLVNGIILGDSEQQPMFCPSDSAITAEGQLTFATTAEERRKCQKPPPRRGKKKAKKNQSEEAPAAVDGGNEAHADGNDISEQLQEQGNSHCR